jgi:hypothetical protein
MARRRATATFDVATAAASAQHARRRTKWMSDDAATLAVAALDHHPHPDRMTQEEVRQLVDAIGMELNTAAHQHSLNPASSRRRAGWWSATCRRCATRGHR